jgi:hypothetical protein
VATRGQRSARAPVSRAMSFPPNVLAGFVLGDLSGADGLKKHAPVRPLVAVPLAGLRPPCEPSCAGPRHDELMT